MWTGVPYPCTTLAGMLWALAAVAAGYAARALYDRARTRRRPPHP